MGSTQNKFQQRHTEEKFLFLREQKNNSTNQMVKIQEQNKDIPFQVPLALAMLPTKSKCKTHLELTLALVQAIILG